MGAKCCRSEKKPEVTIVVFGLDNAGKTSIVKTLLGETIENLAPTQGFATYTDNINVKRYSSKLLSAANLHDVGGHQRIRGIWKDYIHSAHAMIFVVDALATPRLDEARDVLHAVWERPAMRAKPVLLLLNKTDAPGTHLPDDNGVTPMAVSQIDAEERLQLVKAVNTYKSSCRIESCSALYGTGVKMHPNLRNGYQWLIDRIANQYENLNERVILDTQAETRRLKAERQERKERVERARKEREEADENGDEKTDSHRSTSRSHNDPFVVPRSSHLPESNAHLPSIVEESRSMMSSTTLTPRRSQSRLSTNNAILPINVNTLPPIGQSANSLPPIGQSIPGYRSDVGSRQSLERSVTSLQRIPEIPQSQNGEHVTPMMPLADSQHQVAEVSLNQYETPTEIPMTTVEDYTKSEITMVTPVVKPLSPVHSQQSASQPSGLQRQSRISDEHVSKFNQTEQETKFNGEDTKNDPNRPNSGKPLPPVSQRSSDHSRRSIDINTPQSTASGTTPDTPRYSSRASSVTSTNKQNSLPSKLDGSQDVPALTHNTRLASIVESEPVSIRQFANPKRRPSQESQTDSVKFGKTQITTLGRSNGALNSPLPGLSPTQSITKRRNKRLDLLLKDKITEE